MEPSDRWREVESQLDRLLDLDEAGRRAALAALEREGADPDVLDRLRQCLDGSFLARAAGDVAPHLWSEIAEPEAEWVGRRLGAWRIVEPIGAGGMGRVFLVERDDGQYRMRAALKLFARMERPELLDRFRQERQILAGLADPHIARLLDGGTTEDGRPWLVLEHVEGEPIDRWCERRALGVERRLRLFLQVCDAVAHAHRQLVVHRDLKPGNILVTEDGRARLLDFGIAQLLERGGEVASGDGTRPMRALTPGFAAPEQVRGEAVSTATDVWALGALLHLLLVGRAPWRDGDPDGAELLRRTLEEPPRAPSAAAGSPREARRLRGDLDAIVLHALDPEPERRYASALELAHDVELHLGARPIEARPATVAIRLERFVRRHRLGASLAVFAVALAVAALVVSVGRLHQAERERERAKSVATFFADLLAVGDPSRGQSFNVAADVLLRRALERAETEFAGRPDLQAAIFHQAGTLLVGLNLFDEAREALARAVELRRALAPEGDDDLAASLVRYAYTFQRSERAWEGIAPLEEAIVITRRLHGARDELAGDAILELATYASRYQGVGAPHSEEMMSLARERYVEAEEIFRSELGENDPKVGEVLRNRAFATEDPEQAVRLLERAVAIQERAGEPTQGLGYALADLGILLDRLGRRAEAETHSRRALETLHAIHDDDAMLELTVTNNLAAILRDRGKYAEAEPLYREVLARRERLLPNDSTGRAYALYGLGRVALGLGNVREAELHLNEAARLLDAAEIPTLAAITRGWLSEALAAQGRGGEAAQLAGQSLDSLREALGNDAEEVAVARRRVELLAAGELPRRSPVATEVAAAVTAGSGR